MSDQDHGPFLNREYTPRGCDIVGQRCCRVLDHGDAVAVPLQDLVDAFPTRTVHEAAVYEHDGRPSTPILISVSLRAEPLQSGASEPSCQRPRSCGAIRTGARGRHAETATPRLRHLLHDAWRPPPEQRESEGRAGPGSARPIRPLASMIDRLIVSPMPMPFGFVV